MSDKDSNSSSDSATPDEIVLRHFTNRIKLIRQEFEELLFLKYAADMLENFRKRLLQERWD